MSHVYDVVSKHRSIRKYKDQPVKEDDLQKILRAVQFAPTSVNGQQISVIVIQERATREKLAEWTGGQPWIAEAPVFLLFVADFSRVAMALEREGLPFANMESIEATMVGCVDAGIGFANAMNVAEDLGYGIVPIGAVRRAPDEIIDLLKLPRYVYPVLGMCVGVPDQDPEMKPRLPQELFVHRETYRPADPERLAEYNRTVRAYMDRRTGGKDVRDWSEGVAAVYRQVYFPKVWPSLKRQGFENTR